MSAKKKTETEIIIEKILMEATKNGGTIAEDELIKKLDAIPDFWKKAEQEEKQEIFAKTKNH